MARYQEKLYLQQSYLLRIKDIKVAKRFGRFDAHFREHSIQTLRISFSLPEEESAYCLARMALGTLRSLSLILESKIFVLAHYVYLCL